MSGTVATQPPTKAVFAKQMNSICVQASASIRSLPVVKTMAGAASVGGRYESIEQGAIKQLGKLNPPAALKPHLARFISVLNAQLALNVAVFSAAKSNNAAAFQKAAAAANFQNQSELAAFGYEAKVIGAPACASA
jgi:hypothetical protein